MSSLIDWGATVIFVLAIVHTFSVSVFALLANQQGRHAGLWGLLSEVETVFGLLAMVLLIFIALTGAMDHAVGYMDSRSFNEPLFVLSLWLWRLAATLLTY